MTPQGDLWETACPPEPRDTERLCTQQAKVKALMADGTPYTLPMLARLVGASEAGASARVRDLRKFPTHWRIERHRVEGTNLYEYRRAA